MMKGIKKELILVTLPVYLNVTDQSSFLDILHVHKASVLTDSSMFFYETNWHGHSDPTCFIHIQKIWNSAKCMQKYILVFLDYIMNFDIPKH